MPPAVQIVHVPRIQYGFCCRAALQRFNNSIPVLHASTLAQKRKHQDPDARKLAAARRKANLSRQEVLQTARKQALGDPVRGITTPFVESFDRAIPSATHTPSSISTGPSSTFLASGTANYLNYYLTSPELKRSSQKSRSLSMPFLNPDLKSSDPEKEAAKIENHNLGHEVAEAAISRIVNLDNSSSKDRTRVNIQRCIETFGRHNTDKTLRPKPQSRASGGSEVLIPQADGNEMKSQKTPRVGPDTGSSEVQIAILTVKIRTLANFMAGKGRKDKVNKRNLRLLVHKRQKLLAYLRRKERGGERWQNVTQTLGLTEGTWQGEISL